QLRPHRLVDPVPLRQRGEHPACLQAAQFAVAAAGDQLLRLHEEFDLTYAAAAALDVVAGDAHRPVAAMRMDLPLDRMDVRDSGEVEIFAPDERRDFLQ